MKVYLDVWYAFLESVGDDEVQVLSSLLPVGLNLLDDVLRLLDLGVVPLLALNLAALGLRLKLLLLFLLLL